MTRTRPFDTAMFAGSFVLAAVLGRLTVLPGSPLGLVWPATGVAAAWFAVTGWQRWLALDAAVLVCCSWAVNYLTGVDAVLAAGAALGTVVQVVAFGLLIWRWCPELWGFGETSPPGLQEVRQLGRVVGAAYLSAAAGAVAGPTTLLFLTDGSWTSLAAWLVRNAVSVIAIFPLSLLIRAAVHGRGEGRVRLGRGNSAEGVALAVTSGAVLWLVFFVDLSVSVPFLLLATCVWAGTRFSALISNAHAILVSAGVVVATLIDRGPFSIIADVATRELVVQGYLAVVVSINLTLSVARGELLLLNWRLGRSEAQSREQATMLRTILDTMADGVSVLDHSGRLLLRNPAVTQLVGGPHLDADGRVVSGRSGIFYADGTPTLRESGLFLKALSGEAVEGVELMVRNPSAPDGRMLEVTARPLPDTDPPLIVVVFHDVTADRRERDELASFAGVVAHDLLNPLTVVEGWSDALLEAARSGTVVPPERQAEQLERIARAAQRMQHLVNDLLAFTTSRDLQLNPVRVDLAAVATDVARARVDAAWVRNGVPPTIRVEPDLPAVLAEPVLLRQALDNLVGNAVKYVAAGIVPEVCISGAVVADDAVGGGRPMVRIEVSDNGIGIPVEQQARVFDTFHRAHADGGYRGTGLGLSIVKRIAERHQGNAWAATNPATGGTTMSVTFPAAD